MKNHNEETGAHYLEFLWNHTALGLLPPIKDNGVSELVRIVTADGSEGFAFFDYTQGWVVLAAVGTDLRNPNKAQGHNGVFYSVKAWKHIELYEERWVDKPVSPKPRLKAHKEMIEKPVPESDSNVVEEDEM